MNTKKLLLLFSSLFSLVAVQAQFNKDYILPKKFFLSLNTAGTKMIHSATTGRIFSQTERTVFLTRLDSTVNNKTTRKTLFQKVDHIGTNFGTLLFSLTLFPEMRLNALAQKRDKGYILVGTDGNSIDPGLYILGIDSLNSIRFSTRIFRDLAATEAFGIHRTSDALEQYIITGGHSFFGNNGLFTTKIKPDGTVVWSTTHTISASSIINPTSAY